MGERGRAWAQNLFKKALQSGSGLLLCAYREQYRDREQATEDQIMTDNTTTARKITVPAVLVFARGRGDTRQITAYPTENMTDSALLILMQYGTRYLNDTANGSKKDEWANLHGEALVRTFLDYLATPRVRTASAALPAALVQAIREYLSAKRKIPAWKKAEASRFGVKPPQPRNLDTLRQYLADLNRVTVFPEDKWAGILKGIGDNALAIEARRAELEQEGEEAEDLLG
jgi:hypothetical protein